MKISAISQSFIPFLAITLMSAACGGEGNETTPTTTPVKQAVLESSTTAAPTTVAPTTAAPPWCVENETRAATAIAGINPLADTPTELVATMKAANEYVTWLADEIAVEVRPNVSFLIEYTSLIATVFDGHDEFFDAIPEIMLITEDFEELNSYGFTNEDGDPDPQFAIGPIMAIANRECGSQVGLDIAEVFNGTEQAIAVLDQVFEEDASAAGMNDPFANSDDGFSQLQYEGDLPDAPADFCTNLESEVLSLTAEMLPTIMGLGDQEPSPAQMAELFTSMERLYAWLVDNVPPELTADAEMVRSYMESMVETLANVDPETPEDELGMLMLMAMMGGEDIDSMDLASRRLDTFLSRNCQMDMEDGPFSPLGSVLGGDSEDSYASDRDADFYEGDLPDAPADFCTNFESEVLSLTAEMLPTIMGLGDQEPSPTQMAELFTSMERLYTWLVDNVPPELTADAETVRSYMESMVETLANVDPETPEDELGMLLLMAMMGVEDLDGMDIASLRLDAFLSRNCQMDMEDGPFSILDGIFGGDSEGSDTSDRDADFYEGDLPDAPVDFCTNFESAALSLTAEMLPTIMGLGDQEPSPAQMAELFTSMEQIYAWLVDNVPPELTADAEMVRLYIESMVETLANVDPETPEDELGMLLLTATLGMENIGNMELASLRLDTFLIRNCQMDMEVWGLLDGMFDFEDSDTSDRGVELTIPEATDGVLDLRTMAKTLKVPSDYGTIQEAVDAAEPGELVLIEPGTYYEAVIVETDDIVIRGLDRNAVIIDGEHTRENGFIVFSNGVAIENLTTHSHTSNGIFFTGDYGTDIILDGYRASYVTAYNNGLYGIYAFNATNGLIEHSYGSGHPDSAFYIGQCNPCNAVIRNVLAENNALGYSGTNASGNLIIHDSEWRFNRIGIVPNTLDGEELPPQGNITIAGNWVHNNGNETTPRKNADWDIGFGGGIVVAGGNDNVITNNLVQDNSFAGIALAVFIDDNLWLAERNVVKDNVVNGSVHDLFLMVWDSTAGPLGNCFSGNTFETSIPNEIETVAPCEGEPVAFDDNGAPNFGDFSKVDHTTIPAPENQPQMPGVHSDPVPAAGPPKVFLKVIDVPKPGEAPDLVSMVNPLGVEVRVSPGVVAGETLEGTGIFGTGWPVQETVYWINCAGSYTQLNLGACDWIQVIPMEADDEGNIFFPIPDGTPTDPNGGCAIVGTNGPDLVADTGDEVGLIWCYQPSEP